MATEADEEFIEVSCQNGHGTDALYFTAKTDMIRRVFGKRANGDWVIDSYYELSEVATREGTVWCSLCPPGQDEIETPQPSMIDFF